jgi:glyoxylase-like metal-dependent hydrolase (beta-lactamase superfamily II)
MRAVKVALLALSLGVAVLAAVASAEHGSRARDSDRPELAYLRAVNAAAPPRDPQLLFLLMAEYVNANQSGEGSEFLAARLAEFGPRLDDVQRALYLSAIGLLRARHAHEISLFQRIGWVKETIAMLEEAKRLSGGRVFVVRWIAGVVYAELPALFKQREAAHSELTWCLQNVERAPHVGWLREVYYELARLADARGDRAASRDYLRRSGYAELDKPISLTTPFTEDAASGHGFAAQPRISELIPGKVYGLSGFEFTEYYFVVSEDGRELIAIDAGTRPDSARAAYEALRAYAPRLPPLTSVLITHAHWDHVGGHRYFRSLQPRPKFYARSNYAHELARGLEAPSAQLKHFFGTRFQLDDVRDFKPDVAIPGHTELTIGGTRIELVPIRGGETDDALLLHLPQDGVLFAGDFIMPYLGAPFVEEGSVDGLLEAIAEVVARDPRFILHGHESLTRLFATTATLAELAPHLIWLNGEVRSAVRRGDERAAIQQANLIAPSLLTGAPAVQLAYLVLRENLINRVFDQSVGYWQPDMQGMDYITRADRGGLLLDYLGVSESKLVDAVEAMVADGRHELAATTVDWARTRLPQSPALAAAERLATLKLMEKYQNANPFKFILYSAKIGARTPAVAPVAAEE